MQLIDSIAITKTQLCNDAQFVFSLNYLLKKLVLIDLLITKLFRNLFDIYIFYSIRSFHFRLISVLHIHYYQQLIDFP